MIRRIIRNYRTYKPAAATRNICYHFVNRERRRCFGPANPDKTFYVIRGVDTDSPFYIWARPNLLANYFYVLSHLKYASDRGWVPVVDQLNYPVYNSLCGQVNGTKNAWEYFWPQPSPYTLEEVYRSRKVVLSRRAWFSQWDMGYDVENYKNKALISFYHGLTANIPLKKHIVEHVKSVREGLLAAGERVLGVSMRFGGYSKNSYVHGPGHPIAPNAETLIEVVAEKLRQWKMDKVFLASDEQSSVEKFQAAFGERLAVVNKKRTDPGKVYSAANINPIYSAENIYETTLGYLTEMEILAGCSGLIGSVNSGLRYAMVRNNNTYEHTDILDCGRFPDARRQE